MPELQPIPSSPSIERLRRRASFQHASSQGRKCVTHNFILLAVEDPEIPKPELPYVRIGYTVTRKIGGAVERNRIRRRLREAVAQAADSLAPGFAYVLIARKNALLCPFSELIRDIRFSAGKIMKISSAKPRS